MKLEPVVTAAFHIFFAGLICLMLAFLIETPSYMGVGSGAFELIYTGIFSIGLALVLGVGAAIIRKIISDARRKYKEIHKT